MFKGWPDVQIRSFLFRAECLKVHTVCLTGDFRAGLFYAQRHLNKNNHPLIWMFPTFTFNNKIALLWKTNLNKVKWKIHKKNTALLSLLKGLHQTLFYFIFSFKVPLHVKCLFGSIDLNVALKDLHLSWSMQRQILSANDALNRKCSI